MTYYPDIDEQTLWQIEVVLNNSRDDPEYLIEGGYSGAIVTMLDRINGYRVKGGSAEVVVAGDRWTTLEADTNKLFEDLTAAGALLNIADHTEKMAYFRTATSLLDKIVGIQERVQNTKAVSTFHTTVITFLEDICTPDQRTELMQRLKKVTE